MHAKREMKTSERRYTALHHACKTVKNMTELKYFCDLYKNDLNIQDKRGKISAGFIQERGYTPLEYAYVAVWETQDSHFKKEFLLFILNKHLNKEINISETQLFYAICSHKDNEALTILLEGGVVIDANRVVDGVTLLYIALSPEELEVGHVSPENRDNVSSSTRVAMLRQLLRAGANLSSAIKGTILNSNEFGLVQNIPLYWACRLDSSDVLIEIMDNMIQKLKNSPSPHHASNIFNHGYIYTREFFPFLERYSAGEAVLLLEKFCEIIDLEVARQYPGYNQLCINSIRCFILDNLLKINTKINHSNEEDYKKIRMISQQLFLSLRPEHLLSLIKNMHEGFIYQSDYTTKKDIYISLLVNTIRKRPTLKNELFAIFKEGKNRPCLQFKDFDREVEYAVAIIEKVKLLSSRLIKKAPIISFSGMDQEKNPRKYTVINCVLFTLMNIPPISEGAISRMLHLDKRNLLDPQKIAQLLALELFRISESNEIDYDFAEKQISLHYSGCKDRFGMFAQAQNNKRERSEQIAELVEHSCV